MEELIKLLDKDERIINIKKIKTKLLSNSSFMDKINKLNTLDKYSSEYKKIKKELFDNPDFIMFKQLENDINILILEINQKLKELTDERICI